MGQKNVLMMAVSKGNVSTEAVEIKKYVGIGAVTVIGVNPTKAEIKELMGYEPKEEPTYVGTSEIDGKQVMASRLTLQELTLLSRLMQRRLVLSM